MDLLRGLAVLLIISWHAITVPRGFGIDMPEIVVTINTALSPYRLPTLLVISGMLLSRSLDKPLAIYYEGKARRILWPYVIWTLLTALAIWKPSAIADPVTWYSGLNHLWFLSTLLVCYAVAPLLRRVPGWLVAAALFAFWLIAAPPIPGVSNWIWFGAYFFLGSSIARARPTRMPWWAAAALAVVAVGGSVAAVTGSGSGYAWKVHWIVLSLAGVLFLIWLAPRIPRVGVVRALESVGRHSIYYYTAHMAAIALFARALAALDVPGGWLTYLGVLAIGILLPLALTRTPGAHWLFAFARRPSTEKSSPVARDPA
jgi:surface polysaccharide O-acyltransferase-like enzyme